MKNRYKAVIPESKKDEFVEKYGISDGDIVEGTGRIQYARNEVELDLGERGFLLASLEYFMSVCQSPLPNMFMGAINKENDLNESIRALATKAREDMEKLTGWSIDKVIFESSLRNNNLPLISITLENLLGDPETELDK